MRKIAHVVLILVFISSAVRASGAIGLYADDDELERREQVLRLLLSDLGLPAIRTFDEETLVALRHKVHDWTLNEIQTLGEKNEVHPVDTYPEFYERVLRSSVSKFELTQQPRTVLIQSGSTVVPAPNPDSVLFRYSISTTYAELIPSVADVQAQADAMSKYGLSTKPICGSLGFAPVREKSVNCIVRLGTANRFGRALSGVKGTFNYGQNPQVQQSLIVAGTAAAQKNFSLSGQVDFDPKNLFLSGTDWNTAYSTSKTYGSGMELAMRQTIKRKCNLVGKDDATLVNNAACARKLAGPTGWQLAAVLLIPQTSYQLKNQFDFIKQNGVLIAAPFPTNSLTDVTFSLDLTRIFSSAKSRTDALAALAAFKTPVGKTKSDAKANVEKLYFELMTGPAKRIEDKDWYEGFLKAIVNVYQTN